MSGSAAEPSRGAPGQIAPLIALRWQMVRDRRKRAGLVVLGLGATAVVAGAVLAGVAIDVEDRTGFVLLTPTVLAGFAALSVAAPITAGGGTELYPPEQLVAYPVRARTTYLTSLLLAPINVAWFSQLALVLGLVAFVLDHLALGLAPAMLTIGAYLALATLFGQAVAWAVIGLRQSRAGRVGTWVVAAAAAVAVALAVLWAGATALLDRLPTTSVLNAAANGFAGAYRPWATTTAVLLAGSAVAAVAGIRACGWALRRSGDRGVHREGRPVARRTTAGSVFASLVAVDRASVWRSVPLRRGVLVLVVLPGAVALLAGLDWPSLVLVPGLVAAGAGLLFGVNAFCLDAGGAVWLATLPFDPRLAFWAKTVVLAGVCGATGGTALLAGMARATQPPSAGVLSAVLGATVASTCAVVASCMRRSVRRPCRADLHGPRDTPAPPGTMVTYSLSLAALTTGLGLAFSLMVLADSWALSLLLTVAVALLSLRSLLVLAREYARPDVRSSVTAAVARG